jgi:hypothetical protein
MFGKTSAGDFGPLRLTTVQNEMIRINWCRNQINKHTGRIRQLFKWSVSRELIPASVFQGLQSMSGLRIGRSEARESEPVKPVAIEHVDAVLPFLSPTVAAMVLLQLVRLATILNQSMN